MDSPTSPGTIKVFGSAQISSAPDHAIVEFSVSRAEPTAESAFAAANAASSAVLEFLRSRSEEDVRSSRINLHQRSEWGDQKADGERERVLLFVAEIGHRVSTKNLDDLEDLLTGLVNTGVNQLRSVRFETSALKELRRTARRNAVATAREKAELYADAAGVTLGQVTGIEDSNPDLESSARQRAGRESSASVDGSGGSTDAGMIDVTGRVFVWFAIE